MCESGGTGSPSSLLLLTKAIMASTSGFRVVLVGMSVVAASTSGFVVVTMTGIVGGVNRGVVRGVSAMVEQLLDTIALWKIMF